MVLTLQSLTAPLRLGREEAGGVLLLPPAVILRMLPTDPTPEAYLPQVLQNLRFKTCVSAHTRRRARKAAPVCTARFAQPGLHSPWEKAWLQSHDTLPRSGGSLSAFFGRLLQKWARF